MLQSIKGLTQTLKRTFLYVTVSTLKPTVGMVVTGWPDFNLYRIASERKKERESCNNVVESGKSVLTRLAGGV